MLFNYTGITWEVKSSPIYIQNCRNTDSM